MDAFEIKYDPEAIITNTNGKTKHTNAFLESIFLSWSNPYAPKAPTAKPQKYRPLAAVEPFSPRRLIVCIQKVSGVPRDKIRIRIAVTHKKTTSELPFHNLKVNIDSINATRLT